MASTYVDIRSNAAELAKELGKLPKGFDAKFMTSLLLFSAKPVAKAAQDKAPLDMGILSESLGSIRMNKARQASIVVGPRVKGKYKAVKNDPANKSGWYGSFVEFGTSLQSAQPFMRPAWDSTKDVFTKRFMDNAKRRLDLMAAKLKNKGVI